MALQGGQAGDFDMKLIHYTNMLQDNLQQGKSQPVMTKHEYIQAVETKIERRN